MKRAKIWFDNFATRGNLLLRYRPDILQYFSFLGPANTRLKDQLIKNVLRDFIPSQQKVPHDFHVESVIPRIKDRGILVEFTYNAHNNTDALFDILNTLRTHLKTNTHEAMEKADKSRFFMTSEKIRAFLVQGEPFLEDLASRTASNRLKVEFHGPDPPLERLYGLLRPFGRISDIKYLKEKDAPNYALVYYNSIRGSSSAKNCLNNLAIDGGTTIHLSYDPFIRTNVLKKWIVDHPRVTVPFGITAVLALTYTIFDPVRVFFIRNSLSSRFSISMPEFLTRYFDGYDLRQYIPDQWLGKGRKAKNMDSDVQEQSADFAGREEVKRKIESWLEEKPNTVMLVVGPKGYGKTRLVSSIADKQRYRLSIRCDNIINLPEHEMLPKLASQVGYFPVLSFAWLSKIADALLTATTGQKAGFSTTVETEIRKVLQLATVALSQVIVEQKMKNSGALKPLSSDSDIASRSSNTSNIEYPVVVITNFMDIDHHQFSSENQINNEKFYETLAEWAAFLAQNEIAHVIFVSSGGQHAVGLGNTGGRLNKMLTKALPNRSLELVVFSDASKQDSMAYLRQRLSMIAAANSNATPVNDKQLERVIDLVGGRLSDLEVFVGKVRAGQTIEDALDDLISKASLELRRYGLGEYLLTAESQEKPGWTKSQFWYIVKLLAKDGEIKFETLRNSAIFHRDANPIHSMERAELISVIYENGHPTVIRPSKPLYLTAMRRMCESGPPVLSLDLKLAQELLSDENKKVQDLESELKDIITMLKESQIPVPKPLKPPSDKDGTWIPNWWTGSSQPDHTFTDTQGHPILARYHYLCHLLVVSQRKVEIHWQEIERCKKALKW